MTDGTSGVLNRVTGSAGLFGPDASGGETLFLLWTPGQQASLPIASLWSEDGIPADPGWFVFLAGPVGAGNAQAVEAELRRGLGAESATGLVWAKANGAVACAVPIAFEAGAAPSMAADSTLPTPAGLLALSFAAGSTLRSIGDVEALLASPPADSGPVRPGSGGATIWIRGERAGCVAFEALVGQAPAPGAAAALMQVSLDPLRPFDPSRSFQTFTGVNYGFAADGEGRWRLVALEDGNE